MAPSCRRRLTSSIATELRTSSVSGLKVSPHTAMRLSFKTQSVSLIFFRNRFQLVVIHAMQFPFQDRKWRRQELFVIAMKAAKSFGKQIDPP